jgi:CHAD domain-containing protein
MFTAARDAEVLVTCFDNVADSVGDEFDAAARERIHERLERDAQHAELLAASPETCNAVSTAVCRFRSQLGEWKLKSRDATDLLKGLRRTDRAARCALQAAAALASVEHLHEWRKQAKYLWHETEVLERVGPRAVRQLGKQLHTLTQILGDDHDVVALRQALSEMTATEPSATRLISSIDRQRTGLQIRAFRLGEPIFREESDVLIARLGSKSTD